MRKINKGKLRTGRRQVIGQTDDIVKCKNMKNHGKYIEQNRKAKPKKKNINYKIR